MKLKRLRNYIDKMIKYLKCVTKWKKYAPKQKKKSKYAVQHKIANKIEMYLFRNLLILW